MTCESNVCDCNTIKSMIYTNNKTQNNIGIDDSEDYISKCCSECFLDTKVDSSCTGGDGVTNHTNGESWLEDCQQCECKVSIVYIIACKERLRYFKLH